MENKVGNRGLAFDESVDELAQVLRAVLLAGTLGAKLGPQEGTASGLADLVNKSLLLKLIHGLEDFGIRLAVAVGEVAADDGSNVVSDTVAANGDMHQI